MCDIPPDVTNKIITSPFGDKVNYTGHMDSDFAEGCGIGHYFELNRTYVYNGTWNDGKANGQGEAVWDDGDIYNGTWKDGFMNCQGTYKWSSGDVYEGILKHFV
jgi:hypothetical protein